MSSVELSSSLSLSEKDILLSSSSFVSMFSNACFMKRKKSEEERQDFMKSARARIHTSFILIT